jgi:ADP-ribose pyrophosphatase YjhB (NUDIX family)
MQLEKFVSDLKLRNQDQLSVINRSIDGDKFIPICKQTVTYIVAVVLLNENNEICLIEEAKKSCRHQWYLPAGRVEPNENLTEAAIREAKEETGYLCEPLGVCLLELDENALWYRFTFLARITGDALKTQPDEESLQAKWFALNAFQDSSFMKTIRSRDILVPIEKAISYYNFYQINSFTPGLTDVARLMHLKSKLPSHETSYENIYFTFLVLSEDMRHCLCIEKTSPAGSWNIPSIVIAPHAYNRGQSEHYQMFAYVLNHVLFPACFKSPQDFSIKSRKIASIGYTGSGGVDKNTPVKDGINILFLIQVVGLNSTSADSVSGDLKKTTKQPYKWMDLEHTIQNDAAGSFQFISLHFN